MNSFNSQQLESLVRRVINLESELTSVHAKNILELIQQHPQTPSLQPSILLQLSERIIKDVKSGVQTSASSSQSSERNRIEPLINTVLSKIPQD